MTGPAAGEGPNPHSRSLRAGYLVATDAQDNPGGAGRSDDVLPPSGRPTPI